MRCDNFKAPISILSKLMIINLIRIKWVGFYINKTSIAIIFTLSLAAAQLNGQDFGGVRTPSYLAHRDLERQAAAVKLANIQRASEMHRMQREMEQLLAEKMRLKEDALKRLPAIASQLSEISIEPDIDATEKFRRAAVLSIKNADILSVTEVSLTFNRFYKLNSNANAESYDASEYNSDDEDVDMAILRTNNELQNLKKYVRGLELAISYFDHKKTKDSFSEIDDNFRMVERAFSALESAFRVTSSETKVVRIKDAIQNISSCLISLKFKIDDFEDEDSEDGLSEIEYEFIFLKFAVTNCELRL